MPIEEFLKSLELPKKYYDSNFDISEKYAEEAEIFIKRLKEVDVSEFQEDKREQAINMIKIILPDAEANINRSV